MLRRAIGASLACSIGSALLASGSALAAVPHTVLPGESLWSISVANNLSVQTVAAYNGLSLDAPLLVGTTVYVPTAAEAGFPAGVAAPTTQAPGMATIPSPYGDLPLQPAAADAWNRMREEALSVYGIDLYPGGPLSAYRTYEQQAQLYDAYLAGHGAPANPPGTSSHEWGTAVDVATPEMRSVIDEIGAKYGWTKVHGPGEWWHVDYVGG
ncbi:MAG TPA: D-alanyl-D-alanine carboxypeptidase family protein [Thermoleophilaceae bacterium]|nr:D-alanyl-D-alanine carboxypeptidase family protein [Thermoleophilaceae bacterium]